MSVMDEGGSLFLSRDITKGGKLQIRHDDRLGRSVRGIFGYITDKKENQIFLIHKEIHKGAVAKSYMRKGFLIYEEMLKFFVIYPLYMTLQLLHSEFPYI
jgi:hypothetical protein